MLNQVVLVGRLKEMKELGDEQVLITLSTPRPYKNENGEFDIDYIDIILRNGVANNTKEYCKIGDLIGIKGRIENIKESVIPAIVADRVTFLSSKKEKEVE